MSKYIPWEQRSEEVRLRGDRLTIFRSNAENLLELTDEELVKVVRPYLQWFKTGDKPSDLKGFQKCIVEALISEQLRVVAHAKEVCDKNKANRSKGRVRGDGGQPPSTTVNDGGQSISISESISQSESQSKAKNQNNHHHQDVVTMKAVDASSLKVLRPTLESVVDWAKNKGRIPVDSIHRYYSYCSGRGWASKGKPITDWKSYFLRMWENEFQKKVAEHDIELGREFSKQGGRQEWWRMRDDSAVMYLHMKTGETVPEVRDENGRVVGYDNGSGLYQKALSLYDDAIEHGEEPITYYRPVDDEMFWCEKHMMNME